jgi:hypothetical protein
MKKEKKKVGEEGKKEEERITAEYFEHNIMQSTIFKF